MKKNKIIILSGAGISAPSGIETFRDSNGLWENHSIEKVCNIKTWLDNYELVHNFYNKRRTQLKGIIPNKIHHTIAKWQQEYGIDRVINITQNVDNLFEKANTLKTLHLHGFLTQVKCNECGYIEDIGENDFNYQNYSCSKCNNTKVKPNIVFFGEQALNYHFMKRFLNNVQDDDIIIYIGSSGLVINLDSQIKFFKGNYHITTILNNLEKTKYINENLYDNFFYENGLTAIEKINEIIIDKMN